MNTVTPRTIDGIDALAAWVGKELACSDWVTVDQARIDAFAEVTGDRQWIHVDPERAARESPYGATVAHGYLTLSLLPMLMGAALRIDNIGLAVNYGLDRVRFPAPVRCGQRLRARLRLEELAAIDAGGIQVRWDVTVDIDSVDKPGCVAQLLARYYPAPAPRASTTIATEPTHQRHQGQP